MSSGYLRRYQTNKVVTASPGELLLAFYDNALIQVQTAKKAIDARNFSEKGQSLGKVLAILQELDATINDEAAPELSRELHRLYSFMIERVQVANVTMDAHPLDEVEQLLRSLQEAWQQAIQSEQATIQSQEAP